MTEERKKARAKGMFGLSVVVGFMAFAFAKGGELNDWNATGLGIAVVYDFDGKKLIAVIFNVTSTDEANRRVEALKATGRLLSKDES